MIPDIQGKQKFIEKFLYFRGLGDSCYNAKMVFGNFDLNSGSGVIFTTNPKELTNEVILWGDFIPAAQGKDIVSGLVKTYI